MGKNRRPSLAVPIDRKGSGTPAPIAVPGKVYGKTTSASPVTPTFTSVKRRGSGGDTLVAQPSSPTLTLATLLEEPLSIEHALVENDPRLWSNLTKNLILALIAYTSMGGILAGNIFFPAIANLERDLDASAPLVAASVSLFILGQGVFPSLWSALGEMRGRKLPYLMSLTIFCGASAGCASSTSISMFIGLRVVQALGSSAVLSLGAGTLADIYDIHERGSKFGIYYAIPLLGPSLGPIIGGELTTITSWRMCFWFLLAYGGSCLFLMLFLPETYRKERSIAYQKALKRAKKLAAANAEKPDQIFTFKTTFDNRSSKFTEFPTKAGETDDTVQRSAMAPEKPVRVNFNDVNPFKTIGKILKQKHNLFAIMSSAILFASQYTISFTSSKSFSHAPYNFRSITVGLVLLAYGIGNIVGSILGGRYSDNTYNRLKLENNDVGEPEMRLQSTKIALFFLPPLFVVYAWLVQFNVEIAGPVVTLVLLGFTTIWIYSSTLTFVVDSNPGNAGSAVACNSLLRGILAAIASQVSGPLINLIGVGWFYTGFAVIILGGEMLLLLTANRGKGWREAQAATKKTKAIEGPEVDDEVERLEEIPDVEEEPIYAGTRRGSHIDV